MSLSSALSHLLTRQRLVHDPGKPAEAWAASQVLRVHNLSVDYRNRCSKVAAVCDANFEIFCAEIVGIFGPSGSGKTSLGLALLDLLPRGGTRQADLIDFEGRNLLKLTERQMRSIRGKRISMMHQEPALSLNPVMRVGSQISEVIGVHETCTRRERRSRVMELLSCVGLDKTIYHSYPHELSGGERHRIVIAQALACRPSLVIADEPTAGLDPDLKAALLELIVRLKREMGVSFLVISHDRKMLAEIADRTFQMTAGHLAECHAPSRRIPKLIPTATVIPTKGVGENRSHTLIAIRSLSKSFRKHGGFFGPRFSFVQALREVNLSIARGASLGLTGPSGSGKSTLAKCIAGWEYPDAGEILFHGRDLNRLGEKSPKSERSRIQLVLQDSAAAFNPHFTAEELVAEPLLIHRKVNKEHHRAVVKRLFLETGLEEEMLTRKPLTFSGGQRQRLAIARALILNPELIIFDESTTGLDYETQEQILGLLSRLKAARNLAYMLISHDSSLLSSFADSIATMRNGTIVALEPCGASPEVPQRHTHLNQSGTDRKAFATGELT